MKRTVFTIWAAIAACCTLHAQNQVRGRVLNAGREAVPEAVVTAMQAEDRKVISSTRTDSAGVFTLAGVPGRFLLDVAAFGYEGYTQEVQAADYTGKVPDITLAYITLDEATVTARARPRMVRKGNKVVIDHLDNSPHAQGSDMYSFMRYIPVLDVPAFEGNITLTETGGGCAVLLVNGKAVNVPMASYLKNVHVEDIERIEVVAHPMGEYKVKGSCGIINLVRKKRADEGASFSLSLNDKHHNVNSQDGMFSMNYTRNKTFITTGIYAYHIKTKEDTETDYRFYTDNRQNLQGLHTEEKYITLGGYFNMDYELDKKHTIGLQANIGGGDNRTYAQTDTQYGPTGLERTDSVYQSTQKTDNPHKLTNVGANLNYTFKTDQKGSVLYADIDYALTQPKERIHGTYNKMDDGEPVAVTNNLQENKTRINAYGIWLRYIHVFNNTTQLTTGVSYYTANSTYGNTYSINEDGTWRNDSRFSSLLDFDDHTFTAYATVSRMWIPKLTTMLRLTAEVYDANGKQKTTGEKISRDETNVNPSLYIFFMPHPNHTLSIGVSRDVTQPAYNLLDPSRRYSSENSYTQGNPNLKSGSNWINSISYSFFRDYSLSVLNMFMRNYKATLTRPDSEGLIATIPVNRGDIYNCIITARGDKSLFNNYLYLKVQANMIYSKFSNKLPGMQAVEKDCSWAASVSADVTISKKHNLTTNAEYAISSTGLGAEYTIPKRQDIAWSLSKRFAHSNLKIGLQRQLHDYKIFYEQLDYRYNLRTKGYFSFYASYSIVFGNTRTKNVRNRFNSEMESRMATDK